RAGNESVRTPVVSGTAIPPGPTPVSGGIEEDTTWYAGASPYILDMAVEVSENATLTIEPGARIEASGGGLVIKGKLVSSGGDKQLISFQSPDGQSWDGIVFEQVKGDDSIIEYTRIADAAIGVDCRSSSPVIRRNEFVNNQTAVRVSGGYAKPLIENNIVRKSRLIGMVIRDGAGPILTDNRIQHNDGIGLLIENAGAVLLKHNGITNNGGTGIVVRNSETTISENNIYDNQPHNIEGNFQGKATGAGSNWWGDGDWKGLLDHISGRVSIDTILDGPFPGGAITPVPVLDRMLEGTITADAILMLSNSPYRVAADFTVDSGAALSIQAGVTLLYDKQTSIILKDGGIVAKGTKDHPITFTASGSTPSPGDYMSAVRFSERTAVSSFFRYAIFRYATIALDVGYGMPEITYSTIADSSQSGIRSGNDSAPRVLYNTIARNLGSGGIECVGLAKPKINHNNFDENTVAIQAFSTIFIDARDNFWGTSPPDKSVIFGDNINIEPWLEIPEKDAFCGSCDL
ncbi:MAG: right-handed parallel beta-helix repeat-containing protein, partial [Desulfobacterales bacterium]